jgi:tRNA(Ile)-lysidine synthetase-like protein
MDEKLEPGAYILAVSGGVDSVVLLDLLSHQPSLKLVVAHYDHGIRPDSAQDRCFVESLAAQYDLPFYYEEGNLGVKASEALARVKRYEFLRKVQFQTKSQAIVTAHHQDDRIETAILNMVRGTGRRGLSSLKSTKKMRRPLLNEAKTTIITYAKQHNLVWHEDNTNLSDVYLRNYVRHKITPKLSPKSRKQLLEILDKTSEYNQKIDHLLDELLHKHARLNQLDRSWFIGLPYDVSCEVLLAWMRQLGVADIDRQQIERTTVLIKTLSHGKLIDVDAEFQLQIEPQALALIPRER